MGFSSVGLGDRQQLTAIGRCQYLCYSLADSCPSVDFGFSSGEASYSIEVLVGQTI